MGGVESSGGGMPEFVENQKFFLYTHAIASVPSPDMLISLHCGGGLGPLPGSRPVTSVQVAPESLEYHRLLNRDAATCFVPSELIATFAQIPEKPLVVRSVQVAPESLEV